MWKTLDFVDSYNTHLVNLNNFTSQDASALLFAEFACYVTYVSVENLSLNVNFVYITCTAVHQSQQHWQLVIM